MTPVEPCRLVLQGSFCYLCGKIIIMFTVIGANEAIVSNLTTLGGQAFLLALAGTLGSVLAAWGVYHFFFKERRRE